MGNVYTEFLYWEFLGFVNLAVSVAVYRMTQLERRHIIASEHELSTRTFRPLLSFPSSFTYISLFTGFLNGGGGYLRFQRIHFLDIPTIPWIYQALGGGKISEDLTRLLEAEWLVAMNDWTSLVLAMTFVVAAAFNFATVRQLMLRDRRAQEVLLPAHTPSSSISANSSWHGYMVEEKFVSGGGDVGEKPVKSAEGRSFAVFSNSQQLCAKRA